MSTKIKKFNGAKAELIYELITTLRDEELNDSLTGGSYVKGYVSKIPTFNELIGHVKYEKVYEFMIGGLCQTTELLDKNILNCSIYLVLMNLLEEKINENIEMAEDEYQQYQGYQEYLKNKKNEKKKEEEEKIDNVAANKSIFERLKKYNEEIMNEKKFIKKIQKDALKGKKKNFAPKSEEKNEEKSRKKIKEVNEKYEKLKNDFLNQLFQSYEPKKLNKYSDLFGINETTESLDEESTFTKLRELIVKILQKELNPTSGEKIKDSLKYNSNPLFWRFVVIMFIKPLLLKIPKDIKSFIEGKIEESSPERIKKIEKYVQEVTKEYIKTYIDIKNVYKCDFYLFTSGGGNFMRREYLMQMARGEIPIISGMKIRLSDTLSNDEIKEAKFKLKYLDVYNLLKYTNSNLGKYDIHHIAFNTLVDRGDFNFVPTNFLRLPNRRNKKEKIEKKKDPYGFAKLLENDHSWIHDHPKDLYSNRFLSNCGQCFKKETKKKKFKKCAKCEIEKYCSLECQKKHWKEHKKTCEIFVKKLIEVNKCVTCGNNKSLKRCARCKKECYCSRDCQIKHWKIHKKVCKKL